MLRSIDRPGDVDENFLAADIILFFCDILEEHRQPVFSGIDPHVVPGLEPVVLIGRLNALKCPCGHREAVLLTQFRPLGIGKHFKDMLTQHFVCCHSRPRLGRPVPVRYPQRTVECKKTAADALQHVFVMELACHRSSGISQEAEWRGMD